MQSSLRNELIFQPPASVATHVHPKSISKLDEKKFVFENMLDEEKWTSNVELQVIKAAKAEQSLSAICDRRSDC